MHDSGLPADGGNQREPANVKKKKIANTDLEVSRACLGTMTFGAQADFEESSRMVDRCLDAGINFFDSANVYYEGR